jgi:type IV pilus assembly protein PilA
MNGRFKEHTYMKNVLKKGFTLIELMIVVAIVGILAVLAVFGVRKYITNAKSAEARNSIGAIAKRAGQALERESSSSDLLPAGGTSTQSRRLCADSTRVPASMANVQNKKYQSSSSDWNVGGDTAGWPCLKFSMNEPQYFSYQYIAVNPTDPTAQITIDANGDLNGDGLTSQFRLVGGMQGTNLAMAPSIAELNPDE